MPPSSPIPKAVAVRSPRAVSDARWAELKADYRRRTAARLRHRSEGEPRG